MTVGFENLEVAQPAGEVNAAPGQTISFDQVENVTQQIEEEAADAKAEGKKTVEKIAEKVASKVASKMEGAGEAKPGEVEAHMETPDARPIKAYLGDKEIDLDPNAELEVKINGKVERFKLADVRNNFSGKENWDRKNNEFHTQKSTFEKQVQTINSQVDNILKLAQTDPEAVLFELARLAGKSPAEYAQMHTAAMEGAVRWSEMSDSEKTAAMAQLENKGYRADAERKAKEAETQKAEAAKAEAMSQTAQVLGITADEVEGYAEDVRKFAGVANPEPQHIYSAWVYKQVQEAFAQHAPDTLKENPSLFTETANVVFSNKITNKGDIAEIIRGAYADEDSARKVGRKVRESSQATQTASASKSKEIVSFSDL